MFNELQERVRAIIDLLVAGQFRKLESLTNGVRLPAEQIRSAIELYGRKLVLPPLAAFELMDVVEVQSADPPQWSITMPLWTAEEGRSDLSLELTLIQNGSEFIVELDDIHVL